MDKTNNLIKNFVFTINNYNDSDINNIENFYNGFCNYLIYGFEQGKEGTKHIQGYIQMKKQKRFNAIIKFFNNRAHIEKAQGTPEQNKAYCSKEGNYIEKGLIVNKGSNKLIIEDLREQILKCNSWAEVLNIPGCEKHLKFCQEYFNNIDRRNPNLYKDIILRDWQNLVIDYLNNEGDNRSILFVIDTKGGKGKTFLCNYLFNTRDDIFYSTNGKTNDIVYNYSKNIKKNILIDITRKISLDKINFDAIETIINPIFTSNKYTSGTFIRQEKANCIIFTNNSNVRGLKEYLSEDRIRILDLSLKPKIYNYEDYLNIYIDDNDEIDI